MGKSNVVNQTTTKVAKGEKDMKPVVKTHILFDIENVSFNWARQVGSIPPNTFVHLFYSDRQVRMDVANVESFVTFASCIRMYHIPGSLGKQDLDVAIMSMVGYLMSSIQFEEPNVSYDVIIVSRDNGFDRRINNLRNMKTIRRNNSSKYFGLDINRLTLSRAVLNDNTGDIFNMLNRLDDKKDVTPQPYQEYRLMLITTITRSAEYYESEVSNETIEFVAGRVLDNILDKVNSDNITICTDVRDIMNRYIPDMDVDDVQSTALTIVNNIRKTDAVV